MKNVIISAAIALFVAPAFAQSASASDSHGKSVSIFSKETPLEGKEKEKSASGPAGKRDHDEYNPYDLDRDGKLSAEERAARKAAKIYRRSTESVGSSSVQDLPPKRPPADQSKAVTQGPSVWRWRV